MLGNFLAYLKASYMALIVALHVSGSKIPTVSKCKHKLSTYSAEIDTEFTVGSVGTMDKECGVEEGEGLEEEDDEDNVLDVAQSWVVEI